MTKAGTHGGGRGCAHGCCFVPTHRQLLGGTAGSAEWPRAPLCSAVAAAVWAMGRKPGGEHFLGVAHSNPWDTPWTPTPGSGAVDQPQSQKHQRKSDASYSAPTNHSSVLWPHLPWLPPPHHCFLSQKRYS